MMDWDAEVDTWVADGLIEVGQKDQIVARLTVQTQPAQPANDDGRFGRTFWAEFVSSVAFVVGVSIMFLALIFLLHQVIPDQILQVDSQDTEVMSNLHLIDSLIYWGVAAGFVAGGWFVRSKGWFRSITNSCYFIGIILVQVAIIFLYISMAEKDLVSAGLDLTSNLLGTVFILFTIGAGAFGLLWGWRNDSYAVAGVGAASLLFSIPMSLIGYVDFPDDLAMDIMAILTVAAAIGLLLQRKLEDRPGFAPVDLIYMVFAIGGFSYIFIARQFLFPDDLFVMEKSLLLFAYGGAMLAMAAPWRNIPGMIISAFVLVIAVNIFGFEYGDVLGGVATMFLSGIAIIGVGVWAILNLMFKQPKIEVPKPSAPSPLEGPKEDPSLLEKETTPDQE